VISKEPYTKSERHAVFSLASLYVFRMLGLFMVLPLLSVYASDLPGATPQLLGIALGAYGLTQALLQLPLGWLSDRIGRRPVVLGGLVMFITGSVVAAIADDIDDIIIGRFLQGCGAIAAALTAMAADYTRDSQRTKTMAIIGASVGLSFIIALVIGPALAAVGGLSLVFSVTAGLGVVGLLIVGFVLPDHSPHQGSPERGEFEVETIFGGGLPALYLSIFLLHALLMAAFLVVPTLLADEVGLPANQHWAFYFGAVILSLPPALMMMRRGRADGDPRGVVALAISSMVGGALVALNAPTLLLMGVGMLLLFVGVNALEAILPALLTRLAPSQSRGAAAGIFSTSQFLGIFVGGVLGGYVMGVGGANAVSYAVFIVLVIWLPVVFKLRLAVSSIAIGDE